MERTFAWVGNFRRLVVRYERLASMYEAFLHPGLHNYLPKKAFEMTSSHFACR